jgi:hypothetical protein
VKKSLAIVMSRLDMDFKDIDLTAVDLIDEFKFMNLKDIREALRNGSLAKYGITYKLNTQVICFWIREYLKSKKSKLL